jgi:hypothetical protein
MKKKSSRDEYRTVMKRQDFNEVDMIRHLYHALNDGDIELDSDESPFKFSVYHNEFFSADLARINIYLLGEKKVLIKHQLIEVKYDDKNLSGTINQIKKREEDYRQFGMENFLMDIREKMIKAKGIDEKLYDSLELENKIESILFHNCPTDGLKKACESEKIRLFEYKVPKISYFKEIK